MIVDGNMQYLFDETGRRYLDVSSILLTCRIHATNALFVLSNSLEHVIMRFKAV